MTSLKILGYLIGPNGLWKPSCLDSLGLLFDTNFPDSSATMGQNRNCTVSRTLEATPGIFSVLGSPIGTRDLKSISRRSGWHFSSGTATRLWPGVFFSNKSIYCLGTPTRVVLISKSGKRSHTVSGDFRHIRILSFLLKTICKRLSTRTCFLRDKMH